jgi:hypothetical protein
MPAAAVRQPIVGLALVGAILTVGAFFVPALRPDDDPNDLVTRQTARVALLFWGVASAALLLRRRELGRAAWTVGCVTFLVHVVTAFDRVHGWSHAAASQHVESVSGFGPGLFASYLFTAVWVADVVWWWLDRPGYESRPTWFDRLVHGFFAFMVFNGSVVYETGFIRWAGLALFALLTVLLAARRPRPVEARA